MKPPLKILFLLRRIGPYHHARFQAAAKKLCLITAETRPYSTEYPWQFSVQGDYLNIKFPKTADPESGLRGAALKQILRELIEQHTPDVIVTTGWADPEYHAAILMAHSFKIPRVVISDSRYEDEPRKGWKEWIKTKILKAYSTALVAGTSSRQYLLRLGFPSQAIYQPWDVVENTYFLSAREFNEGTSFSERYFICVSRFIEKKNLVRLLKAFANYRKRGGRRNLHLAGSGPLEALLKREVKNSGLVNEVVFYGFKQYEELPSLLGKAYCLILPSLSDQWGLVVNEAMASSLPVMVSKECGCSIDLVKGKNNGCIFAPQSIDSISDAFIQMDLLTEKEWEDAGKASLKHIQAWGPDSFAVGILQACEHAVLGKPRLFRLLHILLSR